MTIFRLKNLAKGLVLLFFMGGLWAVSFAAQMAPDFDFYSNELIAKESYRKISMDFRDASMKDILKIFSEQSGLNFIASDKVKDRTVTLYLDQVPLQEALDKIVRANNLAYDLDPGSNIFIVRESGRPDIEIVTKVYYLKYSRSKDSKLQKAIDGAGSSGSSGSGGGASGAGAGAGAAAASSGGGGGIEDSIKNVLTKDGKVVFDGRTNSLIISDIPTQFDVVERVIALLDTPTPQVMIEVEMLDVSKDVVDAIGVNLSGQVARYTGSDVSTNTPSFLFNRKLTDILGGPSGSGPSFQYGTISTSVFTALLDYLSTDTKTKVLARPRILTLSNETASIEITANEAIGGIPHYSDTGALQFIEAERAADPGTGISLKVTPQVDPVTQNVTMYVEPTVAESKSGGTFLGTTFKDVEKRTSRTTLMVKSGETIVVGGLIKNKDLTTIKKMPVLGDIPIIGMAFRHKDKTVNERELLVFLTPRILGYENSATLAKGDAGFPEATGTVAYREQAVPVSRKEEVDNMLQRWEN